jgi:hypothetical protein
LEQGDVELSVIERLAPASPLAKDAHPAPIIDSRHEIPRPPLADFRRLAKHRLGEQLSAPPGKVFNLLLNLIHA